MSRFIAATASQQIIWEPQAGPQTALLECPVFEVFYGGARGGGKTESSIGDWLQHSSLYGEYAIGIFVRRKLTQLSEVIARTKQIFSKLGAKYQEQQKTWTMANGARLKFVYLERDTDAEEYQGHSYTRIYVEELTNFPSPGPIDKLRATLRSGTGVPCGMRLTGNPGGPGHNWVKGRYIVPNPAGYQVFTEDWTYPHPDTQVPTTVSLDRVFIPSKLGDNRLLMINDPTYVLKLRQSGSEALVKAWLEGNWDVVDGAFFDEWDESKHVLPYNLYENFRQMSGLRFRAFDWGSASPFSVGWYLLLPHHLRFGDRLLPKGALIKYREWYGASGPNKGLKLENSLIAEGIMEREKGERISYGVADPAVFIRSGGPSIADQMVVKRCSWRLADNKRVSGAEMMHSRLKGENGVPMLYFLETCEDSIRTIPVLQHDEKNPEDLDTAGEDHSYDETRYAVMSRPWQPGQSPTEGTGLPTLPSQTTINELIERLRRKRLQTQEDA